MATKTKRLPEFKTVEEEAVFWETNSIADFWDALEPVSEPLEVAGKKRLLSVRLGERDMDALRQQASRNGLGTGTLARVWILERLRREKKN